MDWGLFWGATTAAATLATAISTSAVLWLRRRERPEPDWSFDVYRSWQMYGKGGNDHKELAVGGSLMNAGDGSGFGLVITSRACWAGFRIGEMTSKTTLALMQPGDTIRISAVVWSPSDVVDASVTLTWTESPTRLKRRRSITWKLGELVDLSDIDPSEAWVTSRPK